MRHIHIRFTTLQDESDEEENADDMAVDVEGRDRRDEGASEVSFAKPRETLRTELQQKQSASELAERLVRAIYCEMFGASTPFAIIPAMGLAQHPNPRA